MRQIEAALNSNVFWGVIFLALLLFGAKQAGVMRACVLGLAWLTGSFWLYRFWSSQTVREWRLLTVFLLGYTAVLLFVHYWGDPHRPVSRVIIGEPVGRGRFITSVSLLNVGALPVDAPIANPRNWRKPTTRIHLIFQDSPSLTSEMREQITEDLSAFREYLLRLEIRTPEESPPIGISTGPGSSQARVWGSLPSYRSSMSITHGPFLDRRAVTAQYADFVMNEILQRRAEQHPTVSGLQDMQAASALAQYFNWSFWDHKAESVGGYWSSQLWEIRRVMGKEFTDKLAAFTLKSIFDSPEEGADPDTDIYFHRKIQIADSIIDDNAAKMAEITAIIEKFGINVTKPRAVLSFAATAVKRNDGSFIVKATIENNTDTPAGRGKVRLHFAPDVELLREPDGSEKDRSTTLRSARVFPFDSLSAHATAAIRLELHPVSGSFDSDVILHFDYECLGCAKDSYSHDLKFRITGT